VHRHAVDSIFQQSKFNSIFRNIIEEKANALLMDEETVNFYHYNLNIQPLGIKYAVNYLRSILSILSKYNGEQCKDLVRQLKHLRLIRKEEYIEKSPAAIVEAFEGESF